MTHFGLFLVLTTSILCEQVLASFTDKSISFTKVDTTATIDRVYEVVLSSIFETKLSVNGRIYKVALDFTTPFIYLKSETANEDRKSSEIHKRNPEQSLSEPGMYSGADNSLFEHASHESYDQSVSIQHKNFDVSHVVTSTSGIPPLLSEDVSGHSKVNENEGLIVHSSGHPPLRVREADEDNNGAVSKLGNSNDSEKSKTNEGSPSDADRMKFVAGTQTPSHDLFHQTLPNYLIDQLKNLREFPEEYQPHFQGPDFRKLAGHGRLLPRKRDHESFVAHNVSKKYNEVSGVKHSKKMKQDDSKLFNISIDGNSFEVSLNLFRAKTPPSVKSVFSKNQGIDAILGLRITPQSFFNTVLSETRAGYSYMSLYLTEESMTIVVKKRTKDDIFNIEAGGRSGSICSVRANSASYGSYQIKLSEFHLTFEYPYITVAPYAFSKIVQEANATTGIYLDVQHVDDIRHIHMIRPFECEAQAVNLESFPSFQIQLKDFRISLNGTDYIKIFQSHGKRMCLINIRSHSTLSTLQIGYILLHKYSVSMAYNEQALLAAEKESHNHHKAYTLLRFQDKDRTR